MQNLKKAEPTTAERCKGRLQAERTPRRVGGIGRGERCKLDKPDCFNCPYPECYANSKDIQRQWRMGFKETTDEFLRDALYDRRA